MEKKLLFVINPHSGRAEIKHHALEAIDCFVKQGYAVTVYTTQKTGDATDLVARVGDRFDRVVACGGDGTINEVLNGIMPLPRRPELGIIPAGTTNDYAYSLLIPSNMQKAAVIAGGSSIFNIDVGRFNDRYFTYVAGFGIFTNVTYETPQDAKNVLGGIAYILEGAKQLPSLKSYHIKLEYDDGFIEDDFIVGLFSNSISIAGMRTAFEDARLDDGLLEITLIKLPTSISDIQSIINILLDIEQASRVKTSFLKVVTTKRARLISDSDIAWTVDGESGGIHRTADIENFRRAINVVSGRDISQRLRK